MSKPKSQKKSITKFEAVRELRQRLGWTQQEFAQRTELAVPTVSMYETGKTASSDGVLFKFARLAEQNGFPDLAEILLPGHSSSLSRVDLREVIAMVEEIQAAQEETNAAQARLAAAVEKFKKRMGTQWEMKGTGWQISGAERGKEK